jgi:solute carrier family 25 (mitochondrial aspartate/glutamate transporter), member 12/13
MALEETVAPSAPPPLPPPPPKLSLARTIMSGGTAGIIGQSCVFPMYSVKTRMHTDPTRYRSASHCIRKVLQHEGWRGLYRGLPPALLGVFPEKAIKLAMNDHLRNMLTAPDGTISVARSMLAGAGAGLCQVIATNPMEMLMITMQTRSLQGRKPKSMAKVIQKLGLPGLYRGTASTLCRDVPFSMVFFSMKSSLEKAFAGDRNKAPIAGVFAAGIIAGSAAAAMSTPMDVIKTRLMAAAGGASHSTRRISATTTVATSEVVAVENIASVARDIWVKEGVAGFFTGVVPRILIISPLFGITLLFYEAQLRFASSSPKS